MAKSLLIITPQTLKKYKTINRYLNSYLPEQMAEYITTPLRWENGRPKANNIAQFNDPEQPHIKDDAKKMPSPIQIGVDMAICGMEVKKGDKLYLITKCTPLQLAERMQQVADWYDKNNIPRPQQGKRRARNHRTSEPEEGDVPITLPSEPDPQTEFDAIDPKDIPF